MDLTEDFRKGVVDMGMRSLEQTAQAGEPFMPKMLVDIDGELTVMSYPSSFEGLQAVAGFLIAQGKPVRGICLTVDTYHLIAPKGESLEDAERYAGRLQEEFEKGNKMVCEALHLTFVAEDTLFTVSMPYVREGAKGQRIAWRDAIEMDASNDKQKIQGRFPELLQAIIAATNMEGNGDAEG